MVSLRSYFKRIRMCAVQQTRGVHKSLGISQLGSGADELAFRGRDPNEQPREARDHFRERNKH